MWPDLPSCVPASSASVFLSRLVVDSWIESVLGVEDIANEGSIWAGSGTGEICVPCEVDGDVTSHSRLTPRDSPLPSCAV
jgi:hypothetical protein